jgi:hypothetical protein
MSTLLLQGRIQRLFTYDNNDKMPQRWMSSRWGMTDTTIQSNAAISAQPSRKCASTDGD